MTIIILLSSVFIGAGISYFFHHIRDLSRILLTFSGAFLLTATVLEIFPEIYHSEKPNIGLFILFGVFLQIILEAITKGAEHGHFHHHKEDSFPISIFLGLIIHAFIEGTPLHEDNDNHLLYTIAIHKIPVAIVLTGFIMKITTNRIYQFLFILIFAFASPIGYWFGHLLPSNATTYILAMVAGIFLHISTVIIFESSDNHRLKLKKIIALLLGFAVAYLTIGHHH
ncbi:MAG: ZIP family metal transporter [Weeksellaceae bacterium]